MDRPGVLMLPLLLVSTDVPVLYLAIPHVSQDLEPSATQQLWILDIYGFVLAGLPITMGALGDRIGRRKLVLAGAVIFGADSVAVAYTHTADLLIAVAWAAGVRSARRAAWRMIHREEKRLWAGCDVGQVGRCPGRGHRHHGPVVRQCRAGRRRHDSVVPVVAAYGVGHWDFALGVDEFSR